MVGDFNTKVVRQSNMSERAIVDFGVAQRNERRHSGRMSNIKDIQDHEQNIPKNKKGECHRLQEF